jgi:NAD(P)-dependent dehydrogenase (short-subunit alcohol dehydrogenase family)
MIRSFLGLVGTDKEAAIVNVGSWGMLNTAANGSSYSISKLALGKLSEAVPVAYPRVTSICYHPGMTVTDMAYDHPEVLPFCGDTRM